MTSYMVLSRNPDQSAWTERGIYEGNGQREAKAKALADMNPEPETIELEAVPTRSWDPETVTRRHFTHWDWAGGGE